MRWSVHADQFPADVVAVATVLGHAKDACQGQEANTAEKRCLLIAYQVCVLVRFVEIGEKLCAGECGCDAGLETRKHGSGLLRRTSQKSAECLVDKVHDAGLCRARGVCRWQNAGCNRNNFPGFRTRNILVGCSFFLCRACRL